MSSIDVVKSGARDRHRRDVERRRIGEVALALFDEHGFDRVTVEQIAHVAGVSPMTVYRHVRTKASVVFSARDREVARLREATAAEAPERDARLMVVRAVAKFAADMSVDREEYALRLRIIRASPQLRQLALATRRAYEEAILDGLVQATSAVGPNVALRVAAAAAAGVIDIALREWHDRQVHGQWEESVATGFLALWPDLDL